MMLSPFVVQAKKVLELGKHKLTASRLRILELLDVSTGPLSPYDIQKTDPSLDVVSVYRALELFQSLGLVHKIWSLGGYIACKLGHCVEKCCHEFQVCTKCKAIQESHGHHSHKGGDFALEQHISEKLGLCDACFKAVKSKKNE